MWSSGRSSGCAPSPPPQHWPWRVWCAGCARPSAPDGPEKAAGRALERRTPAPATPAPQQPLPTRQAGVQRPRSGPATNHSTTEKPRDRDPHPHASPPAHRLARTPPLAVRPSRPRPQGIPSPLPVAAHPPHPRPVAGPRMRPPRPAARAHRRRDPPGPAQPEAHPLTRPAAAPPPGRRPTGRTHHDRPPTRHRHHHLAPRQRRPLPPPLGRPPHPHHHPHQENPMTPARRTARACRTLALITTASALYSATHHPLYALPGRTAAGVLAYVATAYDTEDHRIRARHHA